MMRCLLLTLPWLLCPSIAFGVEAPSKSGISRKAIDESVRPQDDLFLYTNGEWLKHTPIPQDKSNYGAFEILQDEAELSIRQIVADAVEAKASQGSNQQRIGDFFKSYMDEATIDARGLTPLADEIAKIEQLASIEDVVAHFGHLQLFGAVTPIRLYVDQDDKNSTEYLVILTQGGITLPDRDYYLKDDPKHQAARTALKQYIVQVFELSDLPNGTEAADAILDLETEFAEAHWTRTELRDANKRYNKYSLADLPELAGEFRWAAFFDGAGLDVPSHVNVTTPSYYQALARLVGETPIDVWRQYLTFHLIDEYASALPAAYVDAKHALYGKQLAGVPELKPRWKRAVQTISGGRGFGVLGDAVGQIYVERHFPKESEKRMQELVANLLRAYEQSIDDLSWMTSETKQKALDKLSKITTKIGYTESWRDYSELEIRSDDLVGNLMRSARVEFRRMTSKLGKPVDRQEWHMTPQTVNAYHNSSLNEIVFPAAILQPPFFQVDADDAVNYGSIGAVIGHEISHAFDDQGSKYDGDGNLVNWWTDADRVAFTKLTSQLVDQYERYSPLEGKRVNGQLTLGENIADLSGMSIAYKAYQLALNGRTPPEIDDWTGSQRFFLGWAQCWRRKYRDAEMVRRLLIDPHSPAHFRGNGPCTNFQPFYDAFDLKPADGLYRPEEERIRIW